MSQVSTSSRLSCSAWGSLVWRLCSGVLTRLYSCVMFSACRVGGHCPSITATLEEILPSSVRKVVRLTAISLCKESIRDGSWDESRGELLLRQLWWRCFLCRRCRCRDESDDEDMMDVTDPTFTCFSKKRLIGVSTWQYL